ncbi:MAG: DegV family protein [Anaeroplasmataceae bacterium]|jgi:EDD domain protein, DegV family|nr:DegV family protein [Anaeroplasmataceae bacterium]
MIRIITDSTNDLDAKTIKEHNIMVLPLYVNFSDASFKDGEDITTPELYELVRKKNELPKTAAIPMQTFVEVFSKLVAEGDEILFTGISKQMSRTYENAVLAAKEVAEDKIFIVDSMNLSTGIGLLVLKACKYRDQGLSAKNIADKLNQDNKRVLSQFAIETMDYLHKGGRCSSVAKLFGTLLKIKPIIAVRDGKMHVAKKPHGKMKVALDYMIEQLREDMPRLDKDVVIVTHSMAFEYNEYIRTEIQKFLGDIPVLSTVAGCVISSHCGQGTIGILYMIREE